MRVLMLGWEFPPHISGGLGTACLGLTRGLAKVGVDVTFVVPKAFGDEDRGPTRVLGCNEVPVEVDEDDGEGPRGPAAAAARAARRRVLAVDSALLPYLSAEQYAARLAALEREAAEEEERAAAPAPAPAPVEHPDKARRVSVAKRPLSFAGFYGPDLMAEVERYAKVVEQVARAEAFDVVHAHDWMTYPAAARAAAASGKPLVVHVHACEYDRSGEHVNPAIVAIERAGLAAAHRVVAVSHFTAGILRRRYGVPAEKLRVVHNAVTRREQREGWHVEKPAGGPVVLFLGRVTFQKGPVYFLEAAARVVRVLPDVRFVMSGSGDMLPAMVERAAAMGLARHVRFTGFLSGADVERMFALADLYVMPSVSEPFGISPLEAMAQDVPVIVSRQSGVAEVLASALKVDFWDVEDLANKIVAVLRRPALRQVLTAGGRAEVEGMRWEARAAQLATLYAEVAA